MVCTYTEDHDLYTHRGVVRSITLFLLLKDIVRTRKSTNSEKN